MQALTLIISLSQCLKAATAGDIATLPGISQKSAQILLDFLHRDG
jgi:hypothetical protein